MTTEQIHDKLAKLAEEIEYIRNNDAYARAKALLDEIAAEIMRIEQDNDGRFICTNCESVIGIGVKGGDAA